MITQDLFFSLNLNKEFDTLITISFLDLTSFLLFLTFLLDVSAMLATLEKIANQNTFHAHRHHAKMEALVDSPAHSHTNANAHRVN